MSVKKEEEDVEEDEDQALKHETTILSKEQFEMQKKRLELLIEEKEWAVEEARDNAARSSVKLQRLSWITSTPWKRIKSYVRRECRIRFLIFLGTM